MQPVNFMRPRFTGDRFKNHAIPLEILADLTVFGEMIFEVAKWEYLKEHSERKRIPRGFTDGIEIKLAGIEPGSAIPVLFLMVTGAMLFPSEGQYYCEKARDSIALAIHAAERDQLVTEFLPDSALEYFNRVGRGLKEDEAIEFNLPNHQDGIARLTKETRRKLLLGSKSVKQVTEDVIIRGCLPEVDQDDMTFEIQLPDGRKIGAPIQNQHLNTILEATKGYRSGLRVVLQGVGSYNRNGKLLKIDSVEHISLLDPLDVSARLDELAELTDGWFEGGGRALPRKELQWLSRLFESKLPDDLPYPYTYPTPEGGIRMEWESSKNDVSIEINLLDHSADWHALSKISDEDTSHKLNLDLQNDWNWLLEQIRSLIGVVA